MIDLAAVPKPSRAVPAFATDAESAAALDTLEPALAQRVQRLVEALRVFPKETA